MAHVGLSEKKETPFDPPVDRHFPSRSCHLDGIPDFQTPPFLDVQTSIWISWRIWWYSISMKQFIHYLLDFTRKSSPTIMEKHIQYDIWNGSKDGSIETSLRRGHINVSSFIKPLQRDPPTKIGNRNTFFTKGMVFFSTLGMDDQWPLIW